MYRRYNDARPIVGHAQKSFDAFPFDCRRIRRCCGEGPCQGKKLLQKHPELKSARWLGESLLRFLAVENYAEGVRFLATGLVHRGTRPRRGPILIDATLTGAAEAVSTHFSLGADPRFLDRTGIPASNHLWMH
jgi:hypothetical protein